MSVCALGAGQLSLMLSNYWVNNRLSFSFASFVCFSMGIFKLAYLLCFISVKAINSTIQKPSSSTYSFIEIEKLTWASIQCGNKTGEKVAKAEENKMSQSVKTPDSTDFCNPLQNRQTISIPNVTGRLTRLKRDACFLYPHVHTLVFLLVRSLYKIRGMLTLHPLLPLRQQWDPVKSTTKTTYSFHYFNAPSNVLHSALCIWTRILRKLNLSFTQSLIKDFQSFPATLNFGEGLCSFYNLQRRKQAPQRTNKSSGMPNNMDRLNTVILYSYSNTSAHLTWNITLNKFYAVGFCRIVPVRGEWKHRTKVCRIQLRR